MPIDIESTRRLLLGIVGAAAELFSRAADYFAVKYTSVTAFSAEV